MRTLHRNFRKSAVALALSIAATPGLVNGQTPSLTSVNKHKSSNKSDLKDSVKDTKVGFQELIKTVLRTGDDDNIDQNLAPVIGLSKPMPTKDHSIVTSPPGKDLEGRGCFVVYENEENGASPSNEKRAACVYMMKLKHSGLDRQTRYFRIDLNGKLEKVVLSQSKLDKTGGVVPGSGVKTDQDINSPEVKKTFEAEMKFWLKDWLKKEQKNAAKKTAGAAEPNPTATAL